jgi:hypothetical protein
MDPVTMMLLAQAIPTGLQLAKSYSQSQQAKELEKVGRPKYEIPEAVEQQVNQARYLAGMRELPGQNLMEAKLGQNTAKGISQLQNASANSADLASNIARIYGAQNEGVQNIGLKAGQNWLGQQGQLSNALRMLGQYQQQQWDYNQKQPYEEAKAAEAALREASYRNLAAASTGIASGISGAANLQYQDDRFNKMMDFYKQSPTYSSVTGTQNTTATPGVTDLGYTDLRSEGFVGYPYANPMLPSYNVSRKNLIFPLDLRDRGYKGYPYAHPYEPVRTKPSGISFVF